MSVLKYFYLMSLDRQQIFVLLDMKEVSQLINYKNFYLYVQKFVFIT